MVDAMTAKMRLKAIKKSWKQQLAEGLEALAIIVIISLVIGLVSSIGGNHTILAKWLVFTRILTVPHI